MIRNSDYLDNSAEEATLAAQSNLSQSSPKDRLAVDVAHLLKPLGYELVYLEVDTHRQKTLRLFIDKLSQEEAAVGVEDCAAVSRALDEPLDQIPEVEQFFRGSYGLEVSSPGVFRPLRTQRDFDRFSGKRIKVGLYRPLTEEEFGDSELFSTQKKQKVFLGYLKGIQNDQVLLLIQKGKAKKKGKNNKAEEATLRIPFSLVCKANLEPLFEDMDRSKAVREL